MNIQRESIERVIELEVLKGAIEALRDDYNCHAVPWKTGIATSSFVQALCWFGKYKGKWIVKDMCRNRVHDVHNMPLESICKLIAHITLD